MTRRQLIASLAVAGAASPILVNAQGRESQPPDPKEAADELRRALKGLVRFQLAQRGAAFGDDGAAAADAFVDKGVSRIVEGKDITNGYVIGIAIDGARRFGNEIVTEAQRAKDSLRAIHAGIVSAVAKRICPMFPFC